MNIDWRRTKLCWSLWCHVWVWVSPEEDNLSPFHSKSLPFAKIKITKMQNRLQVAPKFSTCFWRPQTVPSTAQIEDGNMQGIVNSLSDNDTICFAGKIKNISTADYYSFFQGYLNETISPQQIDGLVQDCSNSIANAIELLQSCTKPSKCSQWWWKTNIGIQTKWLAQIQSGHGQHKAWSPCIQSKLN